MPYTEKDVKHKTKKADTPKSKRQWKHVFDSEKASGADEGTAIKAANGVAKKGKAKRDKKKGKGKHPPFSPHI